MEQYLSFSLLVNDGLSFPAYGSLCFKAYIHYTSYTVALKLLPADLFMFSCRYLKKYLLSIMSWAEGKGT